MAKIEEMSAKYADERLSLLRPDISDSSYSRHTKMTLDLFDGYELESAYEEGAKAVLKEIEKKCRCVAKECKAHVDKPVDEEDKIDAYARLDEMEYMLRFIKKLKG